MTLLYIALAMMAGYPTLTVKDVPVIPYQLKFGDTVREAAVKIGSSVDKDGYPSDCFVDKYNKNLIITCLSKELRLVFLEPVGPKMEYHNRDLTIDGGLAGVKHWDVVSTKHKYCSLPWGAKPYGDDNQVFTTPTEQQVNACISVPRLLVLAPYNPAKKQTQVFAVFDDANEQEFSMDWRSVHYKSPHGNTTDDMFVFAKSPSCDMYLERFLPVLNAKFAKIKSDYPSFNVEYYFQLNQDGTLKKLSVDKSSGYVSVDTIVLDSIRELKFAATGIQGFSCFGVLDNLPATAHQPSHNSYGATGGGSSGCGSRGGPGWRKPNGKCASWSD